MKYYLCINGLVGVNRSLIGGRLQPCQSLALLIGPSYLLPSHVLSLANSGAKILNLREASCASAHLESSNARAPLPFHCLRAVPLFSHLL